ncbi:related to lincomycin-condensing protein lmbA [Rhynchosporium agropyri]|uniref:Related to lincomycin-condensing protein lmbA n=1 Tax=Rhynchosporium agropyri TaxID=914238 RepID=A0A1E1KWZ5_9HELO|nr:related to lincomycin-condensing protein lmbA [Rhynchosporium agropyri]
MDIITAIKQCLTGSSSFTSNSTFTSIRTDIKHPIFPIAPTDTELASSLLSTLFTSSKSISSLQVHLSSQIYSQNRLTTRLAQHLLDGLVHALNSGKVTGSTMREAFDKASTVAEEFAEKHPVLVAVMVTLVAIGILVLVMPWAVEALGFGELGPIEGSFAALWQAAFPDVPAGSWFAFFQRMGMVWGKTAVMMKF